MSKTIILDGNTYELKPVEPPEKRRLIMSIVLYNDNDVRKVFFPDELTDNRLHAFKTVFAYTFPKWQKCKELSCSLLPQFTEWKFILYDAQPEHQKWAVAAKDCNLIDSFITDYDPDPDHWRIDAKCR